MNDKNTEIEVAEKQAVDTTSGETTWEGTFFTPTVDIYSNDSAITLLADMPGVAPDDLDIDLRKGVLTLLGKVRELPVGHRPLQQEYEMGGYRRRFELSDDIDAEKIEATMKDGVLHLLLPKAEKAMPRKIEVKIG